MRSLTVELGASSYQIYIGAELLTRADLLLPHLPQSRVAIVTNTTIAPLFLRSLADALRAAGVESIEITLPDGEAFKNWETLNQVYDALLANRCDRKTTLIALGGGVVGDITGFAAATYQRGVPFIQFPTTLLAQVDSSVGGKTGINHPLGKNMIGAFHQPSLVLSDIRTLKSLPDREYSSGLAEVIKYGLIRDEPFFRWLEANIELLMARDDAALSYAIHESCRNKAEVVSTDEREAGIRAILNLGHTFGHAIELGTGYGTWLHGEAVAAGTVIAAEISRSVGTMESSDFDRIQRLFERAKLPTRGPGVPANRYMDLMSRDKKTQAGQLRFVLLGAVGKAHHSAAVPDNILRSALSRLG